MGLTNIIQAKIEYWLQQHPIVAWIIANPMWTLALLGFAVLLLSGLFGAVSHITQQFWLKLLNFPVWLLQKAGGLLLALVKRPQWFSRSEPVPLPSSQERLVLLLDRLEDLRQEQDTVLQEVQAILGTQPLRELPGLANLPKLQPSQDDTNGNISGENIATGNITEVN